MTSTFKRAEKRRETVWEPYLKENEERLINWAIKRGIIDKRPTSKKGLRFATAEAYSRTVAVKALQHKFGKDILIKQMPLGHHYDMLVIISGETKVYEGKFRCYDAEDNPTTDLSMKKQDYNKCLKCPFPIYFLSVSYDNKVRCWDMFDTNASAGTWMHQSNSVTSNSETIEEPKLMYPNDKPLWESEVPGINPIRETEYDKQHYN